MTPWPAIPPLLAQINYFGYVLDGGTVSYILLLTSVAVLAWALILAFTCRRQTLCPPPLYGRLVDLLGDGNAPAARELAGEDPSILARMIDTALRSEQFGRDDDRVEADMNQAAADQHARWSWRLGYLAVAAAVAPMLGLLGTVIGMMDAFATLGPADRLTQQGPLAAAISKALITTYEGLIIAIPTLVIHAVLKHRLGLIVLEAAARADALLGLWRASRRQ